MAATPGQQGITKILSGANAAFNDKVRSIHHFFLFCCMTAMRYRASQWNYGYRTWLL